MKFEVPIYYTYRKKELLLGFNQIKPLHPFTFNNIKKWFNNLIATRVNYPEKYNGEYIVEYDIYYKHARIDPSNVCCIIEKFTLDGLQECGAILNDNVNLHKGSKFSVIGADKNNPRIEVRVYKI